MPRAARFPAWLTGLSLCFAASISPALADATGAKPDATAGKPKDTVRLNFGWPNDLQGRVTYRLEKTTKSARGKRRISVGGSYDVRTVPDKAGLKIKTDNVQVRVDANGKAAGELQSNLQKFLLRAASTPPDFIINDRGRLVRLDGIAAFQRDMRKALNDLIAAFPPKIQKKVDQAVGRMISKAQLRKSVVDNWNRNVGFWVGGNLARGEVYEIKYKNRIPALGNLEVPMVTYFRFNDRVACTPAEADKRCVDLEMRTAIDDKGLITALEQFVATLQESGNPAPAIKKFNMRVTVRLITEPATLIPYRVKSEKITTAVAEANGKTDSTEQVERTEMTYKY